jgi:catechol 2,3-dioxygenase-like lactoylglutathione lyase family enzyme
MALEVLRIDHVNVTVPKELESSAKEFYGRILGLREIPKPDSQRRSGAWYQSGEMQLHLSIENIDIQANATSSRHVCIRVADIKQAQRALEDAGVKIFPDERPAKGSIRFYIRDPAGNRIEVSQQTNA